MPYVFLGLYAAAAGLNIFGTTKEDKKLYHVTKPLLLLFLSLYCLIKTFGDPDWLLVSALFSCFIGDVLLMIRGNIWFAFGGSFFLMGHVLLIFKFSTMIDPGSLAVVSILLLACVYFGAAFYVTAKSRREAPKALIIPMLLYLVFNSATNLFAFSRVLSGPSGWSVVSYVGAVLFFVSDCAVYLKRYDKEPPSFVKTDLFVMTTYITGILLITLGLAPLF